MRWRRTIVGFAAAMVAAFAPGTARAATAGPVLVAVAHPDDEGLAYAGVLQNAREANRPIYVAIATNGDRGGASASDPGACGGNYFATNGLRRDGEARNALALLGIAWDPNPQVSHLFFLGYPDEHLESPRLTTPALTNLDHTYARSSDGSSGDPCTGDFHFQMTGQHAPYTYAELAADFDAVLALIKPTDVYTHSDQEGHYDHREVYRQVLAAAQRSGLPIDLHATVIHPAGTDKCDAATNAVWPNPANPGGTLAGAVARSTPGVDFAAFPDPPCSSGSAFSWGAAGAPESQVVSASMQSPDLTQNLKWQIISRYASQFSCSSASSATLCGYFHGFVKHNEFYWTQHIGPPFPPPAPALPPVADTTAPQILSVRMSTRHVYTGGPRKRRGATFTVQLSEPGRVAIRFQKARNGRKVGRECVTPTKRLRRRRACTRHENRGPYLRSSATELATTVDVRFTGKLGRKRIQSGRWRAAVVARDAAGNASEVRNVSFAAVRR